MKVALTRAQMRAFDRHAIESCHVPGLVLMENAGRGTADVVERMLAGKPGARVAVVSGAGNNGGDGFVVARHLLARGFAVQVALAARADKLTGDARANFEAWIGLRGPLLELGSESDDAALAPLLETSSLIVDALFGTGLDRAIQGRLAGVIAAMNGAAAPKVAVDLPSGLDADTGIPWGCVVQADTTVTFGHVKAGLLTPTGARAAGRVHVVDLGVPGALVEQVGYLARVIDADAVGGWLKPRALGAHKHAAGSVLVMAGSPGKLGAALLVGRGALRTGAGLVTLLSWPEAIDRIESRVVELMTARLDPSAVEASVAEAARDKRVVAAGPGFGLDDRARRAVLKLLEMDLLKVLDADALTLVSGQLDLVASAKGAVILTPHPGEAARLLGTRTADVERDRYGAARELAARSRATVALKGANTIVATPDGMYVNSSGNPALATAGSGDVLAGMVAALACSMAPTEAACSAVFCHGLAADRWRDAQGGADRGLLAGEIAEQVPGAIASLARRPAMLTN